MTHAIALVGMACRYPDAQSPGELWENVLCQRRAFRRLPPERLRLEDYPPGSAEAIAATEAGVLEGYEFDRVRFRVAGSTFREADMTHWLALEVAADAMADAGFADAAGLPHDATGVLVGNSLTGEFSRANLMRLRWPYVRRVVDAALAERGWDDPQRAEFLGDLQQRYKAPFPPVGDDTLAGGLSNTIAGRICNHFDLGGGGYTVDGACASSLLAIATACSSLGAGDLDVAIAGGVDLSLDPFELVGFSKLGALAADEMRVYDARSAGFWPGEGCGFVVLMRHEDAVEQHRRIYAVVRGWGISSDGSGGITRPEVNGQMLALQRAYRRAGFGVESVPYFEGHGTGTGVGDLTELRTLSRARRQGASGEPAAVVGSIKANIGHTKAAAGAAGVIKAVMALGQQVLPPNTGFDEPHPVLAEEGNVLRLLREGEVWPADRPLRAGVSAMGFGGINAHLVLEGTAARRRRTFDPRERTMLATAQDAELFLLAASDAEELQQRVRQVSAVATHLSRSDLADLASRLAQTLAPGRVRAAVVASDPAELGKRLDTLDGWLDDGLRQQSDGIRTDADGRVMLSAVPSAASDTAAKQPAVGLLFTGQGSPANLDGGLWARRFECVRDLYSRAALPAESDGVATEVAQPAIVTASLAGLHVLDRLGIVATAAVGHSLGELTAYHWADAMDEQALLRIVTARGRAIADCGRANGAMASIAAGQQAVEQLIGTASPAAGGTASPAAGGTASPAAGGTASVVIAGLNSPKQTVVSGKASDIEALVARATAMRLTAMRLPVSHAFHSPLVADSVPPLVRAIAAEELRPLRASVASTITGGLLPSDADLATLLSRQMTSPVRFIEAVAAVAKNIDLWIEIGPGSVLGRIAGGQVDVPVVSLDAGGNRLQGLLQAAGTAFVLGATVNHHELFVGRFTRPFDLDRKPRFLANPCELAPQSQTPAALNESQPSESQPSESLLAESDVETPPESPAAPADASPLEVVRQLAARRAELPLSSVRANDRLLNDLHLSSLIVAQLVAEAARALGLTPPAAATEATMATIGEVAEALKELASNEAERGREVEEPLPAGVDSWVRAFTVEHVERPLPRRLHEPVGVGVQPVGVGVQLPPQQVRPGRWRVIAPKDHPLAAALERALGVLGGDAVTPAAGEACATTGETPVPLGGGNGCATTGETPVPLGGIVVCLPPEPDERHIDLLLEGARAVAAEQGAGRFVLVQYGGAAGSRGRCAGFARTLHLEMPRVAVCVVDVPPNCPQAVDWIVAESRVATGYSEARYDTTGTRTEPVLRLLPLPSGEPSIPLDGDDVMLVTGGGKGIAAESAFSLAEASGVRLALLGRSQPEDDAELAGNLQRMKAAGIELQYVCADVTDAQAVSAAVQEVQSRLGTITAVLHGAGQNVPQRLTSLDRQAFGRTLRPKVDGLRNVLDAIDPEPLRLLVTFGSIIARTGMQGQADYATANEWLTGLTERWQAEHPDCHCVALEWSVWSGVGMGERLGALEALKRQGITPIPPDVGVRLLHRLIATVPPAARDAVPPAARDAVPPAARDAVQSSTSVVVAGRFGDPPTLKFDRGELPLLRFLERPRVHVPGVELIADAELSADNDPYLADHVYQGVPLLPAVVGLEAMAQVATALCGESRTPSFEKVEFQHPVMVPEGQRVTIRVAALVRESGEVEVVLRSQETGFAMDHFRATCRFDNADGSGGDDAIGRPATLLNDCGDNGVALPIDPRRDLYGGILFHTGRFQRIAGYRWLRATECVAEIDSECVPAWFGRYLPAKLLLGDAARRDATIHAVQACIPHGTLLPIGIDRLVPGVQTDGPVMVRAKERRQEGEVFTYDIEVTDGDGMVCERWEGLRLRRVGRAVPDRTWAEPLLGPYIERRIGELVPGATASVVLQCNGQPGRRDRSDRVVRQILGETATVYHRPDGKPEGISAAGSEECCAAGSEECCDREVSLTHAGDLTMAVADSGAVACDIEPVVAREAAAWRDLLGPQRDTLAGLIARRHDEDLDTAATRVWSAGECLKKAGAGVDAPLVLGETTEDDWVLLASGPLTVATWVASVGHDGRKLAMAVLVRGDNASV